MTAAPSAPRTIVAARLRQARELRGLSQREVGVRMELDKDTASARISRYESGSMSISLEALFKLAEALEVPPAYLVATTPSMSEAILALSMESVSQQSRLADMLNALVKLPTQEREAFAKLLEAKTKDGSA
ncbi:helix-turn-helix transcriptional regulator [Stenotrophomonas maltophilia]|uniref:helix-turn-helix domain-containing protein n=2 Tax=Stenotrophomonas maltophilia TaxID=40324 RepID=UPI0031CC3EA7